MTETSFEELNAAFIDLLIQRWELILEARIEARRGPPPDDEESPSNQLQQMLAYVDHEIGAQRAEARDMGLVFPLDAVVRSCDLDEHEAEILQLALMPQLELAFRQRFARLNNNILHDFVDADLALGLLFQNRQQRLKARSYFSDDAPLLANKLLSLTPPKEPRGSGLLAMELSPPERLADYVLGRRSLDPSLRPYASLADPEVSLAEVALPEEDRENVLVLAEHLAARHSVSIGSVRGMPGPFPVGEGLTLAFTGPPGMGKTMLAEALAHTLERPVLMVDSGRLAAVGEAFRALVEALFNEARVQGAVLVFDRCEPLFSKSNAKLPALLDQLERFGGLAILTFVKMDELDSSVERYVAWQLILSMPDVDLRLQIWRQNLPTDVAVDPALDVDDLATRYEISGSQIKNACAVARQRVMAKRDGEERVTLEMLKGAAQGQLRASMEDYSVRSRISLTLDDLVLPDKEMTLVREVLDACKKRVYVMSKWGFGRRLVTGKGICALFRGDPGTGKTLCAEIMAAELGIKLYQVSIPKVMSKYIGETEKNISKIFASARANHAMLLFDEADALFTKRVSVENAIDRFSNMEINLLLQEIERFEGTTILTTNLDKNIDDAFARRIQFKIDFPFPKPEARARIWRILIPPECPLGEDVDFEDLGESFELAGGNIKNAVIRAAYRAAARDSELGYDDILFAAEQESKNAGKLFRIHKHDDW